MKVLHDATRKAQIQRDICTRPSHFHSIDLNVILKYQCTSGTHLFKPGSETDGM